MASEFFVRQRVSCFYTAGCGNKMAVSVTGPRAVNKLGGPVIPGTRNPGGVCVFHCCCSSAILIKYNAQTVQMLRVSIAAPGHIPQHMQKTA